MNLQNRSSLTHLLFSVILLANGWIAASASAQHDAGRNAVRELAKGNFAAATKELDKRTKNSPIDQAEHHFVRALAACLQNDGATALKEAQSAVEHGAALQRFVAGPKDAWAPLYQAQGYAEWAAKSDSVLVHGPLIGAVSAESANIWLRTAEPMDLAVIVSGDDHTQTFRGTTDAANDNTVVIRASELQPATAYELTVRIDGRDVARGSFRTTARPSKPQPFSVVLGGGAGFTPKHERMWTTIEQHHPDALFLLGDNVYIDDPTHPLTHRYCYYRRQSQPQWRSLVAKTPTYAIYDDHDFGLNDCVPGPFIDKPAWKRPVWQIFRENWANPAYGGGDAQPGCWFDTSIGDVHFIFLDCRYYRDDVGGTILGPVQKEWLFRTLKASKGTFKVIASSVPWSAGVKPGSRDTWDGYAAEREEIFRFIETQRLEGVVLVSADRHRVDIRKTTRAQGYDLYEVMSSRLTNVHTHGLVQNAKGSEYIIGYNEKPAFAKLDFDTVASPPTLNCRIIDIDGVQQNSFQLSLDQLRH